MTRHSIKPWLRKYVKGYRCFLFIKNIYKKIIIGHVTKLFQKCSPYFTRKKRRYIKQIEKSIIRIEHYKISRPLNDSTVSKFVTKKWVEVNDLSSGQFSANKNIRFKTSC